MRRRIFPNLIGDIAQLEERQAILERIMQVMGFSPENPYTLTVNDGTLNRVLLGKINGDYGIKIVDNAGNNIILANGTIIANAIKSGTLDCSLLTVININAASITVGTLSASKISGGILNCALMTVQNLSAASITTGVFISPNDRFTDTSIHGDKISTGTLNANRIVAGTITADRIVANSITTNEINSLNGGKLIDNTVPSAKITSLSADKINTGTLNASVVSVINLNASNINTGSMSFDRISGGSAYIHHLSISDTTCYNSYPLAVDRQYGDKSAKFWGGIIVGGPADFNSTAHFYNQIQCHNNILYDVYGLDAPAGQKVVLYDNINMLNHNIDACNKIWLHEAIGWYCKTYEDNPFNVLATIKPKRGSKDKENWGKLDHTHLHKSLVLEDDDGKKGMNMLSLIMVQNKAIVELLDRIKILEERLQ